ncbi:MAG: aminotransferase class III-fold pyridoxal phosphate-dependent enzyme, partial [Chloroflexi bacterium]|nr:aminotransferase class III-fold pyridoxal phosphate-dependent enzyme [Chloroflexota bacterium]
NPLATRAGYEVVRYIIENGIPAKVADDGLYLEQRLHSMEDRLGLVTGARGKGLMWAVALGQEAAAEVAAGCLKRGLIVNNVRPDAVRLLPPLTVTREELDEGLDILEQALIDAGGGPAK